MVAENRLKAKANEQNRMSLSGSQSLRRSATMASQGAWSAASNIALVLWWYAVCLQCSVSAACHGTSGRALCCVTRQHRVLHFMAAFMHCVLPYFAMCMGCVLSGMAVPVWCLLHIMAKWYWCCPCTLQIKTMECAHVHCIHGRHGRHPLHTWQRRLVQHCVSQNLDSQPIHSSDAVPTLATPCACLYFYGAFMECTQGSWV